MESGARAFFDHRQKMCCVFSTLRFGPQMMPYLPKATPP